MTKALVKHITKHAMGRETHASIAKRVGVHESTVRRHFERKVDELRQRSGGGGYCSPQALGIDGVDVGHTHPGETDPDKDGLSTIILSLEEESGTPVELLPSQNGGPLRRFLENKVAVTDQRLPIVIDMDDTYRSAIEAADLPTVIVVDRYHINRKANLALRDAESELLGKAMKRVWKKRKAKLKSARSEDPDASRQTTILDEVGPDNEHNLLQEIRMMELVLKAGWRFHSIMTQKDLSPKEAHSRYQDWENGLDPSIREYYQNRVIETMKGRWREQIFNYFRYPCTNGPVEATDGRAKRLKGDGADYTNRTMRVKMRKNDRAHRLRHHGPHGPNHPMPMIAKKEKTVCPSATPASASGPRRPTITVSTKLIEMCASCAATTDPARWRVARNSRYRAVENTESTGRRNTQKIVLSNAEPRLPFVALEGRHARLGRTSFPPPSRGPERT
nr:transposase [Salinibacter altiplanensis]